MEETLPKLKKHAGKHYTSMEAEEEGVQDEYAPRMSLSLSRALTSPDSIAMSETAGEGLLEVQQKSADVGFRPSQAFHAHVSSAKLSFPSSSVLRIAVSWTILSPCLSWAQPINHVLTACSDSQSAVG